MVVCPATFKTLHDKMEHQRTPHIQPARSMPPLHEYDPWAGGHWEKKTTVERIREVAGDRLTEEMVADIEDREAAIRARAGGHPFQSTDRRYRDVLLTSHAPVRAVRGVSHLTPASSYIPKMVAVEPSLELPRIPWYDPVKYGPSPLTLEVSARSSYRTGQSYPNPPFPFTMSSYWVPKSHSRATPRPPRTHPKVRPAKSTGRDSSQKYDTSWVPHFLKKFGSHLKEPKKPEKSAPPPPQALKSHPTAYIMAERCNHEVYLERRPKAKSSCAPQPSIRAPKSFSGVPKSPRDTFLPSRNLSGAPHPNSVAPPPPVSPPPTIVAPSLTTVAPPRPAVALQPYAVASTISNPKFRILGVTSWAGMTICTLKGGGTEPGDLPTSASPIEREEALEDHNETELECSSSSKDEATEDDGQCVLPEIRTRSSTGHNRLDSLRPNRVSDWADSGESAASGADTWAPGGGRGEGAGLGACGGRGVGGGRDIGGGPGSGGGVGVGGGRGAGGGRAGRGRAGGGRAGGGRGVGGGRAGGGRVSGGRRTEGERLAGGVHEAGEGTENDEYDEELNQINYESEEQTMNIRAWEESDYDSDTHDEFIQEPDLLVSDSFSGDESDHTIQRKYKESKDNQVNRAKIKAREIFKRKIKKNNGYVSSEDEKERRKRRQKLINMPNYQNDEDGGDEDDSPDQEHEKTRRRNRQFRYLRESRQQELLAQSDREAENMFRDKHHKIAFAKRVLEKEGFKIEKESTEVVEKTIMLAMSAQAKNKLTQDQYESLRFANRAMGNTVDWPSWRVVLEARKKCRPENMTVNKQGASYNIRDVIKHNIQRYLLKRLYLLIYSLFSKFSEFLTISDYPTCPIFYIFILFYFLTDPV